MKRLLPAGRAALSRLFGIELTEAPDDRGRRVAMSPSAFRARRRASADGTRAYRAAMSRRGAAR